MKPFFAHARSVAQISFGYFFNLRLILGVPLRVRLFVPSPRPSFLGLWAFHFNPSRINRLPASWLPCKVVQQNAITFYQCYNSLPIFYNLNTASYQRIRRTLSPVYFNLALRLFY